MISHFRLKSRKLTKDLKKLILDEKESYFHDLFSSFTKGDHSALHKIKKAWSNGKKGGITFSEADFTDAWKPIITDPPPSSYSNHLGKCHKSIIDGFNLAQHMLHDAPDDGLLSRTMSDAWAIPITIDEILAAFRTGGLVKSVGVHGIPKYVWKRIAKHDKGSKWLVKMVNAVVFHHESLKSTIGLKSSIVRLIPKKDKPTTPLDFRPIALLPTLSKLVETVVWNRIKAMMNLKLPCVQLDFSQGGFQKGRGCSEQAFQLFTLDSYYRTHKKALFVAALDLRKAYDSAPIEAIIAMLIERGLPDYLISYVQWWLNNHERSLLLNSGVTQPLMVGKGVPQGSVLAPFLFNVFIDSLLKRIHDVADANDLNASMVDEDGNILYSNSVVAFADDTTLISNSRDGLQMLLNTVHEWSVDHGMLFHAGKSMTIRLGHGSHPFRVKLNDAPIDYHHEVTIVGYTFSDSDPDRPVDNRLKKAKQQLDTMKSLLRPYRGVSTIVARSVVDSTIRPMILYGSDVFPLHEEAARVWLRGGRTVVGDYARCPNDGILDFVGWRPLSILHDRILVKFLLRLRRKNIKELEGMIHWALDADWPWKDRVKGAWERCGLEWSTFISSFSTPYSVVKATLLKPWYEKLDAHTLPPVLDDFFFLEDTSAAYIHRLRYHNHLAYPSLEICPVCRTDDHPLTPKGFVLQCKDPIVRVAYKNLVGERNECAGLVNTVLFEKAGIDQIEMGRGGSGHRKEHFAGFNQRKRKPSAYELERMRPFGEAAKIIVARFDTCMAKRLV
jgi:hypothetical protein